MSSIYQRKNGYLYYQYSIVKPNGKRKTIQKYLGKYPKLSTKDMDMTKTVYDNKFFNVNPYVKTIYHIDDLIDNFKEHLTSQVKRNEKTTETVYYMKLILDKFCKWYCTNHSSKNIENISQKIIKKWINYRKQTVSNQTVMNNLVSIKSFFTWCLSNDYIESKPTQKLSPLPIQRNIIFPTKDDYFILKCE